jgi:hypothetical protein
MGAVRNPFLTREDDPRHAELVVKIMLKTRLKRITWQRSSTGLTASIPGGLQFSFVLSSNSFIPMGASPSWQLFTVRRNSEELLKIENPSGFPALIGVRTPLQNAVADLFEAVNASASDDLDNAINTIDKI